MNFNHNKSGHLLAEFKYFVGRPLISFYPRKIMGYYGRCADKERKVEECWK